MTDLTNKTNIEEQVRLIQESNIPDTDKKKRILDVLSSSTYCVLPWISTYIDTSSIMRTCCVDMSKELDSFLTRPDGTHIKITDSDALTFAHSTTLSNIRELMVKGEQPEACKTCYNLEKTLTGKLESVRQSSNTRFYDDIEFNTTGSYKLKFVDIRLGTVCNLKCRMCGPSYSTKWVKEYSTIHPNNTIKIHKSIDNAWVNNSNLLELIQQSAAYIKVIKFGGGEPTLHESQYPILDYLVDSGHAKHINLRYVTNLTLLPEKFVSYWKHFNKVHIAGSIDGVDSVNSYIRHPAKWHLVDTNLRRLAEMNASDSIVLRLIVSYQTYNIFSLDSTLSYIHSIMKDKTLDRISINPVWSPRYLNIQAMPPRLKDIAREKLCSGTYADRFDHVINFMDSVQLDTSEWDYFIEYTNLLDKTRNESILNVVPELAEYFTRR